MARAKPSEERRHGQFGGALTARADREERDPAGNQQQRPVTRSPQRGAE